MFLPPANEVWGKVIFLHLSVILFRGGGGYPSIALIQVSWGGVISQHALQVVSQHALQVSRPTPSGEVEGSGQGGVSRSTPGGGVRVSQHALQVSRPTPRGEVEGSGQGGVSRPTPGGSPGPHRGGGLCIPACTEADLPCGRLLPRVVRILLECILVYELNCSL